MTARVALDQLVIHVSQYKALENIPYDDCRQKYEKNHHDSLHAPSESALTFDAPERLEVVFHLISINLALAPEILEGLLDIILQLFGILLINTVVFNSIGHVHSLVL